jgi:hypothetical protein
MSSIDEYGRTVAPPPEPANQGPNVTLALAVLGVLTTLLFITPAVHRQLYEFVIFVLAASFVLVVVWGFWGTSISEAANNRKQRRQEQKAADFLSADFKAHVEDFFAFIDERRSDHIASAIEEWTGITELSKLPAAPNCG